MRNYFRTGKKIEVWVATGKEGGRAIIGAAFSPSSANTLAAPIMQHQ